MKLRCLFFLFALCLYVGANAAQQNAAWKPVDDAMGRPGQDQPDGTHRFAMPRSDLKVVANGVELKAGFALGSWAAFRNMGKHADVMGDQNNNGVYQFSIPRAEKITENGMAVPNSMGITTAINFQSTGAGKSAITGDFVLTAKEVNPVIKALRQNGIGVTALHSHMLEEQPRLFFMHFWANDDAMKLAKGLRAALDQTNSSKK